MAMRRTAQLHRHICIYSFRFKIHEWKKCMRTPIQRAAADQSGNNNQQAAAKATTNDNDVDHDRREYQRKKHQMHALTKPA